MIYFVLITDGGDETSNKGGALLCLGVLITDGKTFLSFIRLMCQTMLLGNFFLVVSLSNGIFLESFYH